MASRFFPFSLSSPSSLLCSLADFWTAACFSWLPLRNVSRHRITGSHLLWFQTYFKPIKNLGRLSCAVPTPAWFPEAPTYLGKGSEMPKTPPSSSASAAVTGGCWSSLPPLALGNPPLADSEVKPRSPAWLSDCFPAELLIVYVHGSAQLSQSLQLLEMAKFILYEMWRSAFLSAHISPDVWGSHLSGMYLEFRPMPKSQSCKKYSQPY